jgi:hypothetical protein
MRQTAQPIRSNNIAVVVLGLLTTAFVAAALANVKIPMIDNDRAAFIVLAVLGVVMCSLGMRIEIYGWLNPFNVVGIVLGSLLLLLTALVLFDVRLPLITSDRAAMVAMAVIMVIKVVLGGIRSLVA